MNGFFSSLQTLGSTYLQYDLQKDAQKGQAQAAIAAAQINAQASAQQFKTLLTVAVIGAVLFAVTR